VHPGADDNASGAAGLVALARAFASGPAPPRSLVFIAFTAEEAGLLGSAHHVAHPAVALDDTVAMINLDMVGRLRDDTVTVFASETGEGLEALVREAAREEGLAVEIAGGGLGPSDHASFTTNGIPAVFFFTGLHPEYHTPDDRAALLEVAGSGRVLALVARVTEAIAAAPSRPEFTGDTQRAAHGSGAEISGYGPYLGTVPAFGGEPVRGVRLSGVRSGSPAEAAGLRSGDVIVVFAGTEVASLEEFAALLFTRTPGARVGIVALRGEERIETEATLGRRR
jgi:membrane-associated protease RseP (regulator of RpoE activity)